ncbi:MAG: hypothetical protein ACI4WG_00435 [Erysipelotrichaceae bacterium]
MLKHLNSYSDYISHLNKMYQLYPDYFKYSISSPDYSKALFKMIFLDVDAVSDIFTPLYSPYGRPAVNQMEIFRSFILMAHFKCYSFKIWAKRLKTDKLLAIISGFDPDNTSAFSSFYDLAKRIYPYDCGSHILETNHFHNSYSKPKGKNQKLENFDKETVKSLVKIRTSDDYKEVLTEDNLLHLFNRLAVKFSKSKGLIDDSMVLSGDGTAVWTHANSSGTKLKDDKEHRFYSDVDANIGWDSDLDKFYFGYSAYNLSVTNNKLKIDLPVFLNLAKASQHDAITLIKSLATFTRINDSFHPSHLCHDCASDNYATFEYAYHLNMIPIIDLNKRRTGQNVYAQHNGISKNGKPLCQFNKEMVSYGRDLYRRRHKFRCPYYNDIANCKCPHKDTCTNSDYGRVVYIKFDTDIKLFGVVPYKSEEWKKLYKNRTCTERINNYILNIYDFKNCMMHGKRLNYLMLIASGINIHLDAYYKHCY